MNRFVLLLLFLLPRACARPVDWRQQAPASAPCVPVSVDSSGATLAFCDGREPREIVEDRLARPFPAQAPPGRHWFGGGPGELKADHPRAAAWAWYVLGRRLPLETLAWQDLVDLKALGPATAGTVLRALGKDPIAVYCGRTKGKGLGPVRLALLRQYFVAPCPKEKPELPAY
jgi:hypothetical protein